MYISLATYLSQEYPTMNVPTHDVGNLVFNTVTHEWAWLPLVAPRVASPVTIITSL